MRPTVAQSDDALAVQDLLAASGEMGSVFRAASTVTRTSGPVHRRAAAPPGCVRDRVDVQGSAGCPVEQLRGEALHLGRLLPVRSVTVNPRR